MLSLPLLERLGAYLVSRPYAEVRDLIAALEAETVVMEVTVSPPPN